MVSEVNADLTSLHFWLDAGIYPQCADRRQCWFDREDVHPVIGVFISRSYFAFVIKIGG